MGKYEIFVHAVFEEKVESRRVVWADVAYRNMEIPRGRELLEQFLVRR